MLLLTPEPDARGEWTLLEPLTVTVGVLTITVPAGFSTDLASVPKVCQVVIPKRGNNRDVDAAAVVHDWCYRTGALPRSLADALFFEVLGQYGVPRWRRAIMALAVGIGGEHSHRKAPPCAS